MSEWFLSGVGIGVLLGFAIVAAVLHFAAKEFEEYEER